MKKLEIFTDGAYSSSRKQGGIGIVFLENGSKVRDFSRMYPNTTNNQMELGAVVIALRFIKEPLESITIYTDSMYVIGHATLGHQRNKNVLLWEEYDKQFERVSKLCDNIKFEHVKGHADSEWNNYCDKIAVQASRAI